MVGKLPGKVGCIAVFFLIVPFASGFGGRMGSMYGSSSYSYSVPYSYYSYYNAVPLYYYCPPISPRVIPVPQERTQPTFANPIPAPPSPTVEPPIGQPKPMKSVNDAKAPVIITTRSLGGFVPGPAPLAKDRCRVGFWNLSGRDVTLTIDNRAWTLEKDRAVTIDLDRQFAWQVDQQPQHVERLSEGQMTHEIVIR